MKIIRSDEEYDNVVVKTEIGGQIQSIELEDCVIDYDNFTLPHNALISAFVGIDYVIQIILTNCYFIHPLRMPNFNHNITFVNCNFHTPLNMKDSVFSGKIRFIKCEFIELINFNNTTFKNLADFWNCIFYKPTIFYKTDFLGTVVFSTATFKENVLFTYSLINDKIIFRGTKFKKGLDLSLSIISGSVNPFSITLLNFKHSEPKNSTEYESDVSENAEIPLKNKSETFRLLKKKFETQSNNIQALDYKNFERSAQSKEIFNELARVKLLKNEGKRKFLYSKLEAFSNGVIQVLNYFSNDYGKSYIRGIIFTISAGFLFFNLSILGTSKYMLSSSGEIFTIVNENNISYYLNFLNPTHNFNYLGSEFLKNHTQNKWFYIWDFLGRIFIGYGIYQTIQAFRKYK